MTVITEPFAVLARAEAEAFGFPDLPIVIVPHPIASLADAELRAIARSCFDSLIESLTSDGTMSS